MSAIDLLKRQHREAEELLGRAKKASGRERVGVLGDLAEALTMHASLEEKHFYPLLKRPGLEGLLADSEREHAEMKRVIDELLEVKVNSPEIGGLLERLERVVSHHVQQEETQVFPRVLAVVGEDELTRLEGEMQQSAQRLEDAELLKAADESQPPAVM